MQNLILIKNAKVYTHTTDVEFDGLPDIVLYHGFVMIMKKKVLEQ